MEFVEARSPCSHRLSAMCMFLVPQFFYYVLNVTSQIVTVEISRLAISTGPHVFYHT